MGRAWAHSRSPLGRWLCRRNRHRRVYCGPPLSDEMVRTIESAFDGPTATLVACRVPVCRRCGISLRPAIHRPLGWESYADPEPAVLLGWADDPRNRIHG